MKDYFLEHGLYISALEHVMKFIKMSSSILKYNISMLSRLIGVVKCRTSINFWCAWSHHCFIGGNYMFFLKKKRFLVTIFSENCNGNAEYLASFDSNRLTSDCIKNGCQLAAQLKAITEHIGIYGVFGTCRVNVSATKAAMEAVIEKRKIFEMRFVRFIFNIIQK